MRSAASGKTLVLIASQTIVMELGVLIYDIVYILIAGAAIIGLVLLLFGLARSKKNNTLTISGIIIGSIFGLILLSLNSDSTSRSSTTSQMTEDGGEISGSYMFTYPTGQVEVINLKRDYSYTQMIYF